MNVPNDHEEPQTTPTTVATPEPTPQPSTPPQSEDWETRYKGLQKTVAKKDEAITELQKKLETLTANLEELRVTHGTTEQQKQLVEQSRQTLEKQLAEVKAERDNATKTLREQAIIMTEFPQLAKLSKYIPPATTEEDFRKNAAAFAEDMSKAVSTGVKDAMTGATPPQKGAEPMANEAEEDRLWTKVTSLAGIPGKEAEYEEARAKWVKLQQSKKI